MNSLSNQFATMGKRRPVISASDITNGLVGWWKFNGDATDSSGNGHDASLTGSPTFSSGALQFNGTNQAASAAVNLSTYNKVSLAFWFWWNSYGGSDDLLFEYTSNFNSNSGFLVDPDAGSSFNIRMRGGGNYNGGSISRPTAATWHHMVINFDRTTGTACAVAVYVDGSSSPVTQTESGNLGASNFANSSLFFMSRNSSSLFGSGKLDDVRLYNRLLSSTEAATLYSNGAK